MISLRSWRVWRSSDDCSHARFSSSNSTTISPSAREHDVAIDEDNYNDCGDDDETPEVVFVYEIQPKDDEQCGPEVHTSTYI